MCRFLVYKGMITVKPCHEAIVQIMTTDLPPKNNPPVRLLLVDDRRENLIALAAVLEPLGVDLVLALSGVEALKQVLVDDFAVILLDVQMPGMDGFETATLIRQREKSRYIPIIFVTANGNDPSFIEQAYGAGAADFLQKPYNPLILRTKVEVFVRLYEQREQIKEQTTLLASEQREREYWKQMSEREAEKAGLVREIEEMAHRQRIFLRDVLSSLTEGRLHLCDSKDDLPAALSLQGDPLILTAATLRNLRRAILRVTDTANWHTERAQDLETAVGEAAMNAVVHGKNATGELRADNDAETIQVWVCDTGAGIPEYSLHRATLERGFTTAGTLGHGFWMMLKTADRVYLLTGKSGTTVVIEQERSAPTPRWMASAPPAYDLSGVGQNAGDKPHL